MARFIDERHDEIIDGNFMLDRKHFVLQAVVVVECWRLVDGGGQRKQLTEKINAFPMNQLSGSVGDL